ncbi:DgyrCDS4138 [Dimorphilus gyrociliatus]|uniref:DgyrCDS4138 n=1 Tax=Dimorphilus gyrociliatus TaxID=2664684 RepID=A0A7I8VI63_9ANNE|nr:DgyrCDS4138 [Dimorphilus gyrociliatus]
MLKACVFVGVATLIAAAIAGLTVGLYFGLIKDKGKNENAIYKTTVEVNMILQKQYSLAYRDETSDSYKLLLKDIHNAVNESLWTPGYSQLNTFSGIRSLRCSRGSIVAEYIAVFESKKRPVEKISKSHLIDKFEKSKINRFSNWEKLRLKSYKIGNVNHNFPQETLTTKSWMQTNKPSFTTKSWKKSTKPSSTTKSYIDNGANPLGVSCAKVLPRVKSRIVNGQEENIENIPWQAFLYVRSNGKNYYCGAVIIHPYYVLSAASCIKDTKVKHYLTFGADDLQWTFINIFHAKKIWIHEHYNPKTFENDIVLLRVDTKINFNKKIQPICLPERDYGINEGFHCKTSGFGSTRTIRTNTKLYSAAQYLFSKSLCENHFNLIKYPEMICAGGFKEFYPGIPCSEDEGGPLHCRKGDYWRLFGITSFGSKGCTGKVSVFTRVSHYVNWIKQKITNDNTTTT